jgi:hypothetical protein
MHQKLSTILLLGAFASAAPAQTTHLVGPGGFAQIRDALAIAIPGDRLEVQPGTYAHFTATVGVTIRAQVPGTVLIEYDPSMQPPGCAGNPGCILFEGPTRIAPPTGQVVHCIGLEFRPTVVPLAFGLLHRVLVSSGTATFDRCVLRCNGLDALRVDGARVHLQDSTIESFGTGAPGCAIAATAAIVTAVDCTFSGSGSASLPGPAVRLRSSQLQGSRLQLTGGAQLFGGPHAAALDLDAASAAWLSDATLQSNTTGCPIVGNGGGGGWIARSVVTPTSATTCASLPQGALVGINSSTPLQAGALFSVDFRADPTQVIAIVASSGLGNLALPGLTDQPLSVDLASTWLAAAVLTDAVGLASVQWTLPVGASGLPLFVLGAGLQSNTLALSPPLGGVLR